jgi:thiaminase/transcriptional activator TenA
MKATWTEEEAKRRHTMVLTKTGICRSMKEEFQQMWDTVLAHPFLQALAEDRLTNEQLGYYFQQNTRYIDSSSRARAIAQSKAPDEETMDFFIQWGAAGQGEFHHQLDLVKRLGFEPVEPAPACHAYTRHLLTCASMGPSVDYLVACLPCPWTYDEIGHAVCPRIKAPITSEWMATYGSDGHLERMNRRIGLIDRLAAELSQAHQDRLREIFKMSLRYEWMFWDDAWTRRSWPI